MSTIIRISGVDVERLKDSIRILDAIEMRSTAHFTVVDRTGIANYVKGQPVNIITDLPIPPFAHPQFSGFIETVVRKKVSPKSDIIYWSIKCIDNHYLVDKRMAAEIYLDKTAFFIVNDLIINYLAAEGITAGTIQAGPTFDSVIINYQSISKIMDLLAEKSGFIWYVDMAKGLHFGERSTTAAPFTIDSGDIIRELQMQSQLTESNPSYRNTQYLRGGKALTPLPSLVETFTGDGVNVAFTVGYPIAKVPAVTVNAVVQSIGIKGVDVGKQCYWSKGDPVIVFVAAPAAVAVVITYRGEYSLFVLTSDNVAINTLKAIEGGSGIVENMGDDPSTSTRDDALDAAIAKLDRFGITGKQFSFPIRVWGLQPGQMVTVTYADYDLTAAELLVESVEVTEIASNELRYRINAIEGPDLGDWTGFFKQLADAKDDILNRLTIGEDRIIHILKQQKESLALVEATASHINAYPPNTYQWIALYPTQGASAHVAHEGLALAESTAHTEHVTEHYHWDDADALWDFASWG